MAIRQTFCGRYRITTSTAAEYVSPTLLKRGATAESAISQPWLTNAAARFLRVELDSAPGGTSTRTFTFRIAGADTGLTVTLGPSDTVAFIAADIPITDGQMISLAHYPTGSPIIADALVTLSIDNDDVNVSCYGGNNGGEVITSAHTYGSTPFCGGWSLVGEIFTRAISPTDFSFKRVHVELDAAPGVGNSLTFDILINGASTSLGLVISDNATSGTAVCDIAVGVNDVVAATCIRSSGTNTINVKAGYRVETVTDGEMIVTCPTPAFYANSVRFYRPSQIGQVGSTSEPSSTVRGGGVSFQLQKLTASIQRALVTDMGDVSVALRKNGATEMLVVIPGTGWLAGLPSYATQDTTSDVTLSPGDSFDIALITGSGTTWAGTWSFVQVQFADVEPPDAEEDEEPTEEELTGEIGPIYWVLVRRQTVT